MSKKTTLILGNITFLNPQTDGEQKAIVHEIYGIIDCTEGYYSKGTPQEIAEEIGEDLCNIFIAYLIPEVYGGEIVYECPKSLKLPNIEE